MRLEKPGMRHYQQVMEADKAYRASGEDPYCGMRGRAGYAAWLMMVAKQAKLDVANYGMNPNEIWLLIDDEDKLCGFGQFRPLNTEDVLTWAGHIGYSVPPTRRSRGYATVLLRLLLKLAFERGLPSVLLTCDTDNEPSRRVIEKCGGRFDGFYLVPPFHKRLYWFDADKKEDYR